MTDTLLTLWFPQANARGHLVRLGKTWQHIAQHNPCPAPVQEVLGHMVAATTLMSASLKFAGSVVVQVHGDGPVRMMVAECNHRLGLRATLALQPEAEKPAKTNGETKDTEDTEGTENPKAQPSFGQLLNAHGKGLCTIVLDPQNREAGFAPYQGMVPLQGQNMAEALQAYMQQSEQLETHWVLHSNAQHSTGLLLQHMPSSGGHSQTPDPDPDAWPRLLALAQTLGEHEQLNTDLDTLAHRLFWEEAPQVLATRRVQFECSCSRSKVAAMLQSLGESEVQAALKESTAEQPVVQVNCHFCGAVYPFNAEQCAGLFGPNPSADAG